MVLLSGASVQGIGTPPTPRRADPGPPRPPENPHAPTGGESRTPDKRPRDLAAARAARRGSEGPPRGRGERSQSRDHRQPRPGGGQGARAWGSRAPTATRGGGRTHAGSAAATGGWGGPARTAVCTWGDGGARRSLRQTPAAERGKSLFRLIDERPSDRRSPGRNPGPQGAFEVSMINVSCNSH